MGGAPKIPPPAAIPAPIPAPQMANTAVQGAATNQAMRAAAAAGAGMDGTILTGAMGNQLTANTAVSKLLGQ